MDQKWIHVLMIVSFYQNMASGAPQVVTAREGQDVDIKCHALGGTVTVWFRLLDNSGMEFIASYNNAGTKKTATTSPSSTFSDSKILSHILTLKSFNKARDSGVYTCAALLGVKELKFGQLTHVVGEEVKGVATAKPKERPCTTALPCTCNTGGSTLSCPPIILGPLAGGCGLLLLLLIITVLYCNKMRTHRCPHHYKRKPRPMPPGKQMQMQSNRHI